MSSPEARPALNKDVIPTTPDLKAASSQPATPGDRDPNKRIQQGQQGSPRPPLASLPYMVQSPTGEVIPMALAVGRADNLLMQPPPPPARQMDIRLPGLQMTPNGGSPVMELTSQQTQPQQKASGSASSHLPMPTSSTISLMPRHQTPIMSMSDSNISMPNLASVPPPVTLTMDLANQMMHLKGSNAKSTVPSPQYVAPVEENAYKTSVVPTGVHTSVSMSNLSNSVAASMQVGNSRNDNSLPNQLMTAAAAQGMLDHGVAGGSRTIAYAPSPTSQPSFVMNPIQAPTAVTYVTTTSQSHTMAMPNNAFDTSTSMPFSSNQTAYPSASNNSALCTSCGCNGQCGGTSGAHHGPTTPHFPPFSGAYLPNQIAFQNFSPNFYHQGNVGNVLPPTPTNNVMNSPIPNPAGTGTPASPRYPSPMPPSPFQNALPGDMVPYGAGGSGAAFPGLIPPAMYLGAMGLANAGQRTNHIPTGHQLAAGQAANAKKPVAITCYNCGARGHRQAECQELTMEAITQNSK